MPHLEGIDLELWKADRHGCNGARASMIDAMMKEKEKLKKLSEMELVELLGRPDESQLLPRNQKFFRYYMNLGPRCEKHTSRPKVLILRINAMGLTKETQVM